MTAFTASNPAAVQAALDNLKRRNTSKRPTTNYFLQPLDSVENLRVLESETSVCFIFDEWDFARFHFFSFDTDRLRTELQEVNWPPMVVADWVSKDGSQVADALLISSGFHMHTVYDRMVCRTLRTVGTGMSVELAKDNDVLAIHYLLFRQFDKYADHIITIAEIRKLVGLNQVIVCRDDNGEIDGIIIFPITGQSCHFNFLYNGGGPAKLAHLLGSFYGALSDHGVNSGFGWVRRTRPQVLKLHRSFGWKTDGLVDYIYMR